MTNCSCDLAGFCERHQINKTPRLVAACKANEVLFAEWEAGRGPGQNQVVDEESRLQIIAKRDKLRAIGRQLWRELFLEVRTRQDLCRWSRRIPRYGCDCKDFYESFLAANPPSDPVSFEWKHALKSAVNAKLGHVDLTLEEARVFWLGSSGSSRW
ncbi:hypothetical protein SH449x_004129 [Pirellulaceae bacterium SH449]